MCARRLVSVPAVLLLAAASVLLAPLWVPALALVDAFRPAHRAAGLRAGAMLAAYLHCEAAGLAGSLALWLALPFGGAGARERWLRRNLALQVWWATTLFGAMRRIYGLALEVEGGERVARGPFLLFLRHASTADTLLPAVLVTAPYGIRLRYVLKRELLWDPCIDVNGHRLPNVFVRRGSADAAHEIEAVGALARGLGPDEGVLIYPEGTRFEARKRARVLERLRASGDAARAARAQRLRHLLPPRRGGPLALLEAAPGADVVLCAHAGFEGVASFADLWRGDLVGRRVRVRLWRVPRAEVPRGRSERIDWLDASWERLDAWIDAQHAAAAPAIG